MSTHLSLPSLPTMYQSSTAAIPTLATSLMGVIAEKTTLVQSRVFEVLTDYFPLCLLFKPELKIDLKVFIQDQMLVCKIATSLVELVESGNVDKDSILKCLEKKQILIEIEALYKQQAAIYLESILDVCTDVLTQNKKNKQNLVAPIQFRIFTLKNALIAIHNPQAIHKSLSQHKIDSTPLAEIKKCGFLFIRDAISVYLLALTTKEDRSFRERLTTTAEQLIPFVRNITSLYLKENNFSCPNDPLTFRDPSGYNHHGLVAATIMETCLNVLGFQTTLLQRSDLEPKVTLATAHSVVRVDFNGTNYIVDPCYIQFHKDVILDESLLPTKPLLVLTQSEVADYVTKHFMIEWKKTDEQVRKNNPHFLKKVAERDQTLLYSLEKLPKEFLTVKPEIFVENAFIKIWDLSTYSPIFLNKGFHEIFFGTAASQKTYNYIKSLNLSSLTHYTSTVDVERRLDELLIKLELRHQNSPEALSLLVQLPKFKRMKYASMLDVDVRIKINTGFNLTLNSYFRSLKKLVNPDSRDLRVIYGCSGADCMSVLLATDANDLTFVDLTVVPFYEFKQALNKLKTSDAIAEIITREQLKESSDFLQTRSSYGGASSIYDNGQHYMKDLALKLFFDLRETGVDLNKVTISPLKDGNGIQIEFPWSYHGSEMVRKRSISFVTEDITQPDKYSLLLQSKLKEGIDIFYMKGSFLAARYYPQFLPHIAKSIRQKGWIMTTDKTFNMENSDPDACLAQNNQRFIKKKTEEIKHLEGLVGPVYDPLCEIKALSLFKSNQRYNRTPGSDLTYWSQLTLRQKEI